MTDPTYTPFLDALLKLFSPTWERAGGSAFRYHHSVQVAHLCQQLAKDYNFSPESLDTLILAGLFHDAAKYRRTGPDGLLRGSHAEEESLGYGSHEDQSAELVSKLLAGHRDDEQILLVQTVIQNHAHPEQLLERILHDADELSEMGYMNVWKMFSFSQATKLDIAGTIDYWQKEDRMRHLEKVKTLRLPQSKALGRKRIRDVDFFVSRLKGEITL